MMTAASQPVLPVRGGRSPRRAPRAAAAARAGNGPGRGAPSARRAAAGAQPWSGTAGHSGPSSRKPRAGPSAVKLKRRWRARGPGEAAAGAGCCAGEPGCGAAGGRGMNAHQANTRASHASSRRDERPHSMAPDEERRGASGGEERYPAEPGDPPLAPGRGEPGAEEHSRHQDQNRHDAPPRAARTRGRRADRAEPSLRPTSGARSLRSARPSPGRCRRGRRAARRRGPGTGPSWTHPGWPLALAGRASLRLRLRVDG